MTKPKFDPIEPGLLYRACDAEQLPFTDTSELEEVAMPVGQERALKSIQFAVRMAGAGYNVFAPGTVRSW
jgi:hypothetical protein